ncbi:hypothetical protein AB1L30_05415 [Bremerella sp. JC817]|uniref:hypothetical protein n=1 Tax=Bremerella sp. JC817 TaxID=3231756 RepID=UPI003458B8C8
MPSLNRIVVLTLVLCLSRIPLPWGHSHGEMDVVQLASHLQAYHPAGTGNDLGKRWHWHVTPSSQATAPLPRAVIEETSETTQPKHVSNVAVATSLELTSPLPPTKCVAALHQAAHRQPLYLRLGVLLI